MAFLQEHICSSVYNNNIMRRKRHKIHEWPVDHSKTSNRWKSRLIQKNSPQPVGSYLLLSSGCEAEPNRSHERIKSASLKHSWKFPQTGRRLVTDTTNRAITAARRWANSHYQIMFSIRRLKKNSAQKHLRHIPVGTGDDISAALHGSRPLIREQQRAGGGGGLGITQPEIYFGGNGIVPRTSSSSLSTTAAWQTSHWRFQVFVERKDEKLFKCSRPGEIQKHHAVT